MLRSWRWAVVIGCGALLVTTPAAVAALSVVGTSDVSAAVLLQRVQNSGGVPYSGYAESTGGLGLPVSSQFSSVADLFGGTTQMRAWWRGSQDWRVDTITLSGETDEHLDGSRLSTWNYEANTVSVTDRATASAVRLPVAGDLLPTALAGRLLSEARSDEVSRLPDRRVAGRDVPGLAVRPSGANSTISEVDVWVDASGAALQVVVKGAGVTVVSSRFLDFSTATPSGRDTEFTPAPGVQQQTNPDPDLAALIDRLGGVQPPVSLQGFVRNPQLPAIGSIGVYGRGVTEFAVSPLFGRTARSLRKQLSSTPGVMTTAGGTLAVSVGPLTLVLTGDGSGPTISVPGEDGQPLRLSSQAWLLVGTVKTATLLKAAAELPAGVQ
ncbi:MAG: transcriptional regulator [Actinomycetota bacterium]|nr:transcriptional regulator [Actinomycetota bacterium]